MEKTKQQSLPYHTMTWLSYELETNKHFVASLRCMLCKHYEKHLQSYKNFLLALITGLTNKRLSNVINHVMSEMHKAEIVQFQKK